MHVKSAALYVCLLCTYAYIRTYVPYKRSSKTRIHECKELLPICSGVDVYHVVIAILVLYQKYDLFTNPEAFRAPPFVRIITCHKFLWQHVGSNHLKVISYCDAISGARWYPLDIARLLAQSRINWSFQVSADVSLVSGGRFSALRDELTSGTIIARKTTAVRFSDGKLPIRELITSGDDEVPLSIAR